MDYNNKSIYFYLKKYKLKDPWDLVDLFEKNVALYAGSKYGIAVDCCTNAIFLSLKYLNSKKNYYCLKIHIYQFYQQLL